MPDATSRQLIGKRRPSAPIRPTRIFFSDMKQLTFLLTVLTNRLPARRVRHIFG
jgi:hypothetical protein